MSPRWGGPVRWAVSAASVAILVINASVAANQIAAPMPMTPWEAGIAVEGWRAARGEAGYGDIEQAGRFATHMYGPLCNALQGAVASAAGLSMPASRMPALVASVALAWLVCRIGWARGAGDWLCAAALTWGVNYRTSNIFAEARPDAVAALLAVAGLVGLSVGYLRGRPLAYLLGLAAVMAGCGFKQTAAVAALVFLGAVMIDGQRPWTARLVLGLAPIACLLAAAAVLQWRYPDAYRAVVWVPSRYRVDRRELFKNAWHLVYAQPLLWLAAAEWLGRGRGALLATFRGRAILVAIPITFATSVAAATKFGGGDNSLLPYELAIAAFLVARLPALMEAASLAPGTPRAWGLGLVAAAALLLGAFPNPGRNASLILPPSDRARAYREAVGWLRESDGPATSPEDPTALVLALGRACRNAYLERDARPEAGQWAATIPGPILREIAAARVVLGVESFATESGDVLTPEALEALGFVKRRANRYYTLWSRPAGVGPGEAAVPVDRGR